jgi:hypothetical protein
MIKIFIIIIVCVSTIFPNDIFYYKNNKKISLVKIDVITKSFNDIDYYTNKDGMILGVKNTILVKFKHTNNLTKYLNEYKLIVKKKYKNKLFNLIVSDKSTTINISNILSLKEDIVYASPNFYTRKKRK